MASATGEPEAALRCQLGLVHAEILSILSSSVDKMFARNPSYDARKLLGMSLLVVVCLAVYLFVQYQLCQPYSVFSALCLCVHG